MAGFGHLTNMLGAADLGCATQNFCRSESRLGEGNRAVEAQAAGEKPQIRDGLLAVPERAGLGVEWDEDELRRTLKPGEPWWG
ncbi:MAG: hypothetical protein GC160_16250 [Acidobacteria bacterium]|nr:hypothetical protein [Acidobacteriota bacterium]